MEHAQFLLINFHHSSIRFFRASKCECATAATFVVSLYKLPPPLFRLHIIDCYRKCDVCIENDKSTVGTSARP